MPSRPSNSPSLTTEQHAAHRVPGVPNGRATGTLVGILYIVGTLAGIGSRLLTNGSGPSGPDYLAEAAAMGNRLPAGALLVLLMGLALAVIPVVVFPILQASSPRLALGYLIFRGALETTIAIVVATCWLTLSQLSAGQALTADAAGARTTGTALAKLSEAIGTTPLPIVFLTGATIFYWALFRARLVPRWLSVWGLVAVVPYLAYALAAPFGLDSATVQGLMDVPLGLQEMVLAGWLIARGFATTQGAMT
ncbi:MAG: DUF4386 domain-containing protein [Dermatophilaceae bacterium]